MTRRRTSIPPAPTPALPLPQDEQTARCLLRELDGSALDQRTVVEWLVAERQQCLSIVDEYERSSSRTLGERMLARQIGKRIRAGDWVTRKDHHG